MSMGMFAASQRELVKEFTKRRTRVAYSLSLLKNQDSEYAQEHRKLIDLFTEILTVAERHKEPA